MGTKNLCENGPSPFFLGFFQSYGNGNDPDSYREIRLSEITNIFVAQIRLHQQYKTANRFRTRRNHYYIWPITLLELKYLCQECDGYRQGYGQIEVHSFLLKRRERALAARSSCLICSKLRRIGGLGGLRMTPRRSSDCGACIPESTTHRHCGRLICLGS